jgi:hypothetical protein
MIANAAQAIRKVRAATDAPRSRLSVFRRRYARRAFIPREATRVLQDQPVAELAHQYRAKHFPKWAVGLGRTAAEDGISLPEQR